MPGVLCVPCTQGPSPAQPLTTLTPALLSFQPRRRRLLCSPPRTNAWQGAPGECRDHSQSPSVEPGGGLSPAFRAGLGLLAALAGSRLCRGLQPPAKEELSSLLGWGPELAPRGKNWGKQGWAWLGCASSILAALGSSVPHVQAGGLLGRAPQAWGLGWALAAAFDKAPFPLSGLRSSRTGSPWTACRPLSWPTWQVMPGVRGSPPCPGRGCHGA